MSICKEKPDNLSLLEVIGKRPGTRSFQTAITGSSALALPSAAATARQVEGTRILRDEFDVTAQQGKFWYAPSVFSIPFNRTLSPVVSSAGTPSVVPIESLLSDPHEKPPFSPEASMIRLIGPGTGHASFLAMGSCESETPDPSGWQSDDSFVQHSKYFFKDGNVTFLVRHF